MVYQVQEVPIQDRLLKEFRAAKGLKAKLASAAEALKFFSDLADAKAAASEMITTLNADIATHQRTQPGVALEAIFIRDELRNAAGMTPAADEVQSSGVWTQLPKFAALLEA